MELLFYAVAKGRNLGIFMDKDDFEKQITDYPDPKYEIFKTFKEASVYLQLNRVLGMIDGALKEIEYLEDLSCKKDTVVIFVDGSFNEDAEESKKYSYGMIVLKNKEMILRISGWAENDKGLEIKNIAGEVLGAGKALEYAFEHNYKNVVICHDFEGIDYLATDRNIKIKNDCMKLYSNLYLCYKDFLNIDFYKIKRKNPYCKLADYAAREALNLNKEKPTKQLKKAILFTNRNIKKNL